MIEITLEKDEHPSTAAPVAPRRGWLDLGHAEKMGVPRLAKRPPGPTPVSRS